MFKKLTIVYLVLLLVFTYFYISATSEVYVDYNNNAAGLIVDECGLNNSIIFNLYPEEKSDFILNIDINYLLTKEVTINIDDKTYKLEYIDKLCLKEVLNE